jgi:hypothetical protein
VIAGQYAATLCTLDLCIDRCADSAWDEPVGNLKFCQVAFHTLFFTDFYLESSEVSIRDQDFHRERPEFFRDYEELEDRTQQLLYERSAVKDYVQHCREKSTRVVVSETEPALIARCDFSRRNCSRAELHIHNIRHIQHHAAQLSLRLRLDTGEGVPWVGSGWRDE